jgi:hypothetical protein
MEKAAKNQVTPARDVLQEKDSSATASHIA